MRRSFLALLLFACFGILAPGPPEWWLGGGSGGGGALPGATAGSITLETLRYIAGEYMVQPPDEMPQYWFSSAAVATGSVDAATTSTTLDAGAPGWTIGAYTGLKVYISSGVGKGQIRTIRYNDADELFLDRAWTITPSATATADTFSIFTGELIPGTITASCTQNDPCLDLKKVSEVATATQAWIWLDSGDAWDTAAEWCTDSPAGRCTAWRQAITFDQGSSSKMPTAETRNNIVFAVSGTDPTMQNKPVIDCDTPGVYPIGAAGTGSAGVFETSFGDTPPNHPGWYLVQNLRTQCWNEPAAAADAGSNVRLGTAGVGVFRVEFGDLIVLHTEHGEMNDSGRVVDVSAVTITDPPNVYAFDLRASLTNFEQYNKDCVGANNPWVICSAAGVASDGAPQIVVNRGGNLLFVGGNWIYRNHETTTDATNPAGRYFFETLPGGADTTLRTIYVNTHVSGNGDEPPFNFGFYQEPSGSAGRTGTTFDTYLINSACTNMTAASNGVCIYNDPGNNAANNGGNTLNTTLINFTGANIGDLMQFTEGDANDLGGSTVARCLLTDEVDNTLFGDTESTAALQALRLYDIQGLYDGDDDGGFLFNFTCDADGTLAGFLAGGCFGAGNPGALGNWLFFQTASAEIGNAGTDGSAFRVGDTTGDMKETGRLHGLVSASAGVYTQGYGECVSSHSIALPAPIPTGIVGNFSPSTLVISGRRNYGMN